MNKPLHRQGPLVARRHADLDKGLPKTGLLARVLMAKYMDHLPLYRQEAIFDRAGHAILVPRWPSRSASAACSCSQVTVGTLVSSMEIYPWTRPGQPSQLVYPSARHLNAKLRARSDWVTGVFRAVQRRAATVIPHRRQVSK